VRLLVLHTAQGALTYQSLGNYFANPSSGVSSHVGIDDTPNTVGEYVRRDYAAWTAAGANGVAVQAELCAFAEWDGSEWARHDVMLANTAAWLYEESQATGIPLVKLNANQAQGGASGVCQHVDLGSWGGNHWDCGSGFPIDAVIERARNAGRPIAAPGGGGQDNVAIVTAPGRVDAFVIGTDHGIYQATGTDWASLVRSGWFRLGEAVNRGKAVSAAWTPDYGELHLMVHGTDDRPYFTVWNVAGWSGFAPNTNGQLHPDPYG
jgi:hypothetical protein